jgi:hypothetical protein
MKSFDDLGGVPRSLFATVTSTGVALPVSSVPRPLAATRARSGVARAACGARRMPASRLQRALGLSAGVAVAALLGACAGYAPPANVVGLPLADVERLMGPATDRHRLPDGGTRAEFSRGPMGRHTWMLDLDAQGRVLRSQQVLTEATFATIRDGDSLASVRQRLGRPSEVRSGGWQGGEVWNWRYDTNDCLWFELAAQNGSARHPAIVMDPRCDVRSDSARD